MKKHLLTIFLIGGASLTCFAEDKPFSSAVGLRGTIDGSSFHGQYCNISAEKDAFTITANKSKRKFAIPIESQILQDVTISARQQAVAALLRSSLDRSRSRVLVTVNASGDRKVYEYKYPHMTKTFGWIVDLGSVSEDGTFILTKCAFFTPAREDGSRWVNHRWVILSTGQGNLKVVESDAAINKWTEITTAKKTTQK